MSDEEKIAGAGAEASDPGEAKEKKVYNLSGVPPAAERPGVSIEQMYSICTTFSEKIFNNPAVGPKLKTAGMVLRMEYYDPENWGEVEPEVTIEFGKDPIEMHTGPCDIEPKAVLRMHSDIAHRFWMQRISMMVALARRQMVAKGPISQVMRLLPIIKPSYPLYKDTLKELGLLELLAYPAEKAAGEEAAEEPAPQSE
ncbi:MAG: hypothetical protein WCX65_19035 [bacterium]